MATMAAAAVWTVRPLNGIGGAWVTARRTAVRQRVLQAFSAPGAEQLQKLLSVGP